MRIAIIEKEIYPFAIGGSEIHSYYTSKILATRGHKIFIISEKEATDSTDLLNHQNMKLLIIKKNKSKFLSFLIYIFRGLLKLIKNSNSIDIIQSHKAFSPLVLGGLFNLIFKKPFFVTVHGSDIRLYRKNKIIKAIQKIFLFKAKRIFSVSKEISKILEKEYQIKKDKIIQITNGYSEELVEKIKKNPKKLNKNKFEIVFVGSLRDVKDPLKAIKVIETLSKNIKSVHLTLIGSGRLFNKLVAYLKNNHLQKRVSLKNKLSHFDTLNSIYNSSIFLLTSKHEGLPTVLIEAMSLGTPIISTDVGGVKEIITNNKTGILVSTKSVDEISNRIKYLYNNPKFTGELSKNAELKVKEFSWENITKIYENEYQN